MKPPRRRVDTTQAVIVAALRTAGASVAVTSFVGQGFPDLLVGWGERVLFLVEAKSPGGKLTADETAWHAQWRGPRVEVVRGPEEAVLVLRKHIGGAR